MNQVPNHAIPRLLVKLYYYDTYTIKRTGYNKVIHIYIHLDDNVYTQTYRHIKEHHYKLRSADMQYRVIHDSDYDLAMISETDR